MFAILTVIFVKTNILLEKREREERERREKNVFKILDLFYNFTLKSLLIQTNVLGQNFFIS